MKDRIFKPEAGKRVDDELAFHIEMHTRDLIARGIDPVEARRRAERSLGDRNKVADECRTLDHDIDRNERRTLYLSELAQDTKFALRVLTRRRSFASIAIATLTIGIGAATAIYSVVDSVLLRPLPFSEPDRIAAVWITQPDFAKNAAIASLAVATPMGNEEYQALRASSKTLESLSLYGVGTASMATPDGVERVPTATVTSDMFRTLRIGVHLGRPFEKGDDALHAPAVALVGYNTWKTRYHSDPAVLGQSVALNGETYRIVGVLPPGLRIDRTRESDAYWMPALRDSSDLPQRHNRNYRALGRIASHASFESATTEVASILRRTVNDTTTGARIEQWQRDSSRQSRSALLGLLAAAVVLLGIACVNVAVLLLGESANRSRELAARAALGAGRGRLARQLLVESLVIAFVSAILGSALAWGLTKGLVALAPPQLPGIDEVAIDLRVLSFAMTAAAATGLLFGVAPALTAGRSAVSSLARFGVGQSNAKGAILQRTLVATQLALSTVLLTNALLLARSFDKLTSVDPGFARSGMSVARVVLPWQMYKETDRIRTMISAMEQRIAALPGVESVALTTSPPFSGNTNSSPVVVESPTGLDETVRGQHTQQRYVGANYLQAMNIRLLKGRYFNSGDNMQAPDVAIISQSEVDRDFGGREPLGLRVRHQGKWRTVVGVVSDIKITGLAAADAPTIYVPFDQLPNTSFAFVVRERGSTSLQAYRRIMREVDANAAVLRVDPLPKLLEDSYVSERYRTVLVVAFALMAALLTTVGMYGVGTRAALRRTREVGIRLALGSTNGAIARLMVNDAMRGVIIGLVLGIPATFALGEFVKPFLFGVETTDTVSYVATAVLLALVTLAASYAPSRRASRADPAMVLRGE
ncbi:MAG: ADOP family duplicated permease [Gemmatimonas sp.]